MARSGKDRLDAIVPAVKAGEEFRARIVEAGADIVKCADLMAEAIELYVGTCGLEIIGRDGRATMCMEELQANYSLQAARKAYLKARGSNR